MENPLKWMIYKWKPHETTIYFVPLVHLWYVWYILGDGFRLQGLLLGITTTETDSDDVKTQNLK